MLLVSLNKKEKKKTFRFFYVTQFTNLPNISCQLLENNYITSLFGNLFSPPKEGLSICMLLSFLQKYLLLPQEAPIDL